MVIHPLPGTTGEMLVIKLGEAERTLRNVRSGHGVGVDRLNAYLLWSAEQIRSLGPSVNQEALDGLVTTRRHWALHGVDPISKGSALGGLVDVEVEQQLRVIAAAREQLQGQLAEFSGVDRILVPDTNVFLHANERFDRLDWDLVANGSHKRNRVVIPMLVIDELDRAKRRTGLVGPRGSEQISTRARATLKAIEDTILPLGRVEEMKWVTFGVLTSRPRAAVSGDADLEIVDQARGLADFCNVELAILTLDTGMRVRAAMAGVRTATVPKQWEFGVNSP